MKKKVDISLIVPQARSSSLRPPLGLMYIASCLRKNNINPSIIDIKSKENKTIVLSKIIDQVKKENPKIVGISCMSSDYSDTIKLTRKIKNISKKTIVIVGGIHATLYPDHFLNNEKLVDFVVMGEGENSCSQLVTALLEGSSINDMTGVGYLNKFGEIVINPASSIKDLNSLPMPAYGLVDMEFYTEVNEWIIRGIPISGFYLFTSRSCPFDCSFCANKYLFGRGQRFRKPELVVDEISLLIEKYKIDGLYFYDDTFTTNKNHVFEICNEIKKRGLNFLWGCETRANLLNEELLREMKSAGCLQIDFGVETASTKLLNKINKGVTVDAVRKAYNLCDKLGIRKLSNYLFNLPGESEADVKQTIALAKELNSDINVFNCMTLYPGTDMFKDHCSFIDMDDIEKFANYDSFDGFLDLIEKKYRLASHNIKLEYLFNDILKEFPTRKNFHVKNIVKKEYFLRFIKLFSFLINSLYLKQMLRSRNKAHYLRWALTLVFAPIIKRSEILK
tara:strand:+ start:1040 stop:2557 length:1518 start_codon:yes stop_codon:yes gene_type:complete